VRPKIASKLPVLRSEQLNSHSTPQSQHTAQSPSTAQGGSHSVRRQREMSVHSIPGKEQMLIHDQHVNPSILLPLCRCGLTNERIRIRKPTLHPCSSSVLTGESSHWMQSPYLFMCCTLVEDGQDIQEASAKNLGGTLVSSLHKLKDTNNTGKDHGFAVVRRLAANTSINNRWRLLHLWRCVRSCGRQAPVALYAL